MTPLPGLYHCTNEYLCGLRYRHDLRGGKGAVIKVGQVVMIKNDERNRGVWNLVIVVKLHTGPDRIVVGEYTFERTNP